MAEQDPEAVPNLRKKSVGMILALGFLGLLVASVVVFFVYYQSTAPPTQADVCRGLAKTLEDRPDEVATAIRQSYPRGYSPPAPGSLVELVSKQQVADTPENLCLNLLMVWEHHLDRDDYRDIARCIDGAMSPATITACAKSHRK